MGKQEADIQRAILDFLHVRGVVAHKQGGVNTRWNARAQCPKCKCVIGAFQRMKAAPWTRGGTGGISDVAGTLPGGRALYIEVKAPGKIPTKRPSEAKSNHGARIQWDYIEAMKAAGAVAFYASSVWDVEEKLRGFLHG